MKMSELFSAAVVAGHLPEPVAAAATRHFAHSEDAPETPWYLHALIAVGAWLSAIFFIAFTGAIFGGWLFENNGAALVVGAVLLVGVVGARRLTTGAFLRQLCLALSITAYGLILFGLTTLDHRAWDDGLLPAAAVLLAAALFELYPDTLHRFLSCVGALVAGTLWLEYERPQFFHLGLGQAALLAHLAALGAVWVRSATPVRFRALGYALAVSLLVLALPHFATWRLTLHATFLAWDAKIILTLALLALLLWIAGPPHATPAWFIGAPTLLVLGAVTTPGVLAALLLLGLGFALREGVLSGLGLVFVPLFLAFHYYQLDLTLLQKSIALAAGGLALLIGRAFVRRLPGEAPAAQP